MTCCFFHNGIYMPKRLIFPSDLSACSQTPCPSAFRLKDMHCEMFQPENILQKNQFPKNWKNTGPAEGFQSRLKDSRAQFFSRKADGQGICEQAERFEGFFKVLYIEYYERPYLTEKSKISSWNMYVVLLCSETYLTLSTKISYFSLQQYRPHGRPAKTIIPKLIANRVPLNHYLCFNGTYSSSSNTFLYAGRIMRFPSKFSSSLRCAHHPTIRAIANKGVNISCGRPIISYTKPE